VTDTSDRWARGMMEIMLGYDVSPNSPEKAFGRGFAAGMNAAKTNEGDER